jgi:uncharacterized membrane protein YeaQ/YmgE (transglycosylase-associated protein family)
VSLGALIYFAAVGWCGTGWPWWWRRPPPPPPPDPWWFIDRIVGIVGGVVGGWLFTQSWPVAEGAGAGLSLVAAGFGALVGSLIILDLYYGFVRRGAAGGQPG